MAYKEPEIRKFILRLRSRASKVDRTAKTILDLQLADSLKAAANSLESWLEEKMPGEIPVNLAALLPDELIPSEYRQGSYALPVYQAEPAARYETGIPAGISILPVIQKIEASFAVSFQAGTAFLEQISTEQFHHPDVITQLTLLVQQYLVSLNYESAHSLASRCLREDSENITLLNLLLISKHLSDARSFWNKGDYGSCKVCTVEAKMLQDGYLYLTWLLQWFFKEAEQENDCFKANRILKIFSHDDPNLPEYLQRAQKIREAAFEQVRKIFKESHPAGMEELKKFQTEHSDDIDILRLAEKQAEEYLEAMNTGHAREIAEVVGLESLVKLTLALDEVSTAYEKRDPAGLKAGVLKANEFQALYQAERGY